MEITPVDADDREYVSPRITGRMRGGNVRGAVQRLLDVADEMDQVAQAHGLVALRETGILQVGDAQIDGENDIRGINANVR